MENEAYLENEWKGMFVLFPYYRHNLLLQVILVESFSILT